MANETIKINPTSPNEIEFEVKVDGADDAKFDVRLVIASKHPLCNFSVNCSKVKGKTVTWMARIPPLPITDSSCSFAIEVIVDGFYFKPVEGSVTLVKAPAVSIKKPSPITETPDITGQYAPTNQLLVPEFEPKQSDIKTGEQGDVVKRDATVDTTRLSDVGDVTVPGNSDHEPQAGAVREPEEPIDDTPLNISDDDFEEVMDYADVVATNDEGFNPRKVAETILRNTMGIVKAKPTSKGSLFKRDKDGHAMIKGLETPTQLALKKERSEMVSDFLKQQ